MLTEENIINIKYSQKYPSITIGIIGRMNSGKSTLNNAIIGKDFCSTRYRRETLSQIIIRHTNSAKEQAEKHIRNQITNINKNTAEELKDNKSSIKIKEFVVNDKLEMINSLFDHKLGKYGVEIFDTMGFDDMNTDPENYKLLEKYIKFMDVLFFITPYDSLFTTESEMNFLKKTLTFIQKNNPTIPIVFIVNKIDNLKSKDDKVDLDYNIKEAEKMIQKKLNDMGLKNKFEFIKISANYINSYRLFDYYKDIKKVSKGSQLDFVEKVIGRRGTKLLDNNEFAKLNKKLRDAYVEDTKWEEDYGWNNIKKFIKTNITNDLDLFFFNQFFKIKDFIFDNNVLINIRRKLRWINSYKKNKYFSKQSWTDIINKIIVEDLQKYNFEDTIKEIDNKNLNSIRLFLNHTFIQKNNWLKKNTINKIKDILTTSICLRLLKLHNLNNTNINNIDSFINKLTLIKNFSKECHMINNNFIDIYIKALKENLNKLTNLKYCCLCAILNSFSNDSNNLIIISPDNINIRKTPKLIDHNNSTNNIKIDEDEEIIVNNKINLGEHFPFGNNHKKYKIDLDKTHYDDIKVLYYYFNFISSKISKTDSLQILQNILKVRVNLFKKNSHYIYKFNKLSNSEQKLLLNIDETFDIITNVPMSMAIKKKCKKDKTFKFNFEKLYIESVKYNKNIHSSESNYV